jgi:hypothetical protein
MTYSGTSQTMTILADMHLAGVLTLSGTTSTVLTGNFNYNLAGLNVAGSANIVTGTSDFVFNGSGTLQTSVATSHLRCNVTINTAGTLTITGASSTLNFGTGTITYVAGTVTANNLNLPTTSGLNTGAIVWNAVTMSGSATMTLSSDLNVNSTLTLGNGANTTTINGAFNINANASVTITGTTAIVTGSATIVMTGSGTVSTASGTTLRLKLTFDSSGTITIGSAAVFNYNTGTLTYISGTINAASATLSINTASTTLDTGGMTWQSIAISGTITVTLLSDLNAGWNVVLGGTTLTTTISGAFNFNCQRDVTLSGTTAIVTGTCTIVMTSDGVLTTPSTTQLRTNFEINSSGTVTLSGTVYYCNRNFKYTAGTVVSTGAILYFNPGAATTTVTINGSGLSLESVTVAQNITFGGTEGFDIGNFVCITAGVSCTWQINLTYNIISSILITGTAASPITMDSSSGGTDFIFTLQQGATQDVGFCSPTDVDSSLGMTIWTYKGTITTSLNWKNLAPPQTISYGNAG